MDAIRARTAVVMAALAFVFAACSVGGTPTGAGQADAGYAPVAFLDRVNEIVRRLHADGTLKTKSIEYFGVDYATAAGSFDLNSIGQVVP